MLAASHRLPCTCWSHVSCYQVRCRCSFPLTLHRAVLGRLDDREKAWRGHAAKACHPALRWQRQHVFDRLKTQTLFIQQAYSRPGRNKVIDLWTLTAAKEAGGTTGRLPRHPPTHAIAAGIRHTMTK